MPLWTDPYANQTINLIQARGNAQAEAQRQIAAYQAQAAQTSAAAQAQAQVQGGQAWGQAIQQFGQLPGQLMQAQNLQSQIEDRKQQAILRGVDIKKGQYDLDALNATSAAVKGAIDPETNQVDHKKAASLLEQAGFPGAANSYMKTHLETEQQAANLQKTQQDVLTAVQNHKAASAEYAGRIAASTLDQIQQQAQAPPELQNPMGLRDAVLGGVATGAANGAVTEQQARDIYMKLAHAGPDQLPAALQGIINQSPGLQDKLNDEKLKNKQTQSVIDKNEAEAYKAYQPEKPDTATAYKEHYTNLQTELALGHAVSPDDRAWAKSYEKEKLLSVDASAGAATIRQAKAIAEQNAIQRNRFEFDKAQAGRGKLESDVNKPYRDAKSAADNLRDIVTAAQGPDKNKIAAAMQNLDATMGTIKQQGLSRLSAKELSPMEHAGSAWDQLLGSVNKWTSGNPLSPEMQKNMLGYAELLEKEANRRYSLGYRNITKSYGLDSETPLIPLEQEWVRDANGKLVPKS